MRIGFPASEPFCPRPDARRHRPGLRCAQYYGECLPPQPFASFPTVTHDTCLSAGLIQAGNRHVPEGRRSTTHGGRPGSTPTQTTGPASTAAPVRRRAKQSRSQGFGNDRALSGTRPGADNARSRRLEDIAVNHRAPLAPDQSASWLATWTASVLSLSKRAPPRCSTTRYSISTHEHRRRVRIAIPGPETDYSAAAGRETPSSWSGKARHPEFPGRFLPTRLRAHPDGEVIMLPSQGVPLLAGRHSGTRTRVDKYRNCTAATLTPANPCSADTEIAARLP